ncbi:4'-demethylrebeccamycin synthase [Escovopsis weberi]|uniref:4'-demethylrebeccamycin synthase n=1 Tax=Escovopsis weberi TaxID=150374 RepID=A0A0M8MST4_ESCWE|nr:4'-demethylrebeccamycin synthase [Escovopsis weberi]
MPLALVAAMAGAPQDQKMHFLLHSHFPASHVPPMAAIAQGLIAKGHTVTWLAAVEHERAVEATGAHFRPTAALAIVDAVWRTSLGVLDDDTRDDTSHDFRLAAQVSDYRLAIERSTAPRRPDVLLVDAYPYGARALHELGEVPAYATLGVLPFHTSTPGAPLPGEGTHPGSGLRSIAGSRFWHLVRRFYQLPTTLAPKVNAQRKALGLPHLPLAEAPECFTYSPMLHIQASSSRVEFFQRAQPARHRDHTVFTGPVVAAPRRLDPARVAPWWQMLVEHKKKRQNHWRTVVIAQDRVDEDPRRLIVPVLRGLAKCTDLVVVVLTSRRHECLAEAGTHPLVLFTDYLPLTCVLFVADLLVTNAGYQPMLQALAAGVPVVCAAHAQCPDKKDAVARMVYTGVCKALRGPGIDPPAVEQLVKAMLRGPALKERALPFAHELRLLGGLRRAVYELEQLGLEHMPKSEHQAGPGPDEAKTNKAKAKPEPAKPMPKPKPAKPNSAKRAAADWRAAIDKAAAAAVAAAPPARGGIFEPLNVAEAAPKASGSTQAVPEGVAENPESFEHTDGPVIDEWLIAFEPSPDEQWPETLECPVNHGAPHPTEPPADLLLPGYLSVPNFHPFEAPIAPDQPCGSRFCVQGASASAREPAAADGIEEPADASDSGDNKAENGRKVKQD